MFVNGSFEEGWTDVEVLGANRVNQRPAGWELSWLLPADEETMRPADLLWDSGDPVQGVPECVHKLMAQLPPHQWPDGGDPLILDGLTVYKVFSADRAFGAQLRQVVTGLMPHQSFRLIVPHRVHRHGDPDPWGAEVGVWVNGEGRWHSDLRDEEWERMIFFKSADQDGQVEILVRVKSKWNRPKDFFFDMISFEIGDAPTEPPVDPKRRVVSVHKVTVWSDGASDHEVANWPTE